MNFGFIMDAIARFSTPTFFMITGYFVMKSDNIAVRIKHQIIKLTKYYIIYEIIYIIYEFAIAVSEMNFLTFKYNLLTDIKYILIAPTIGIHLWYVVNTIWILMIIYVFNKFNKLKVLFIFSGILYLTGIIISNLSHQIFHQELPLYATRNFLFFGLFYVMIGIYISKTNIHNLKLNDNFILFIAVVFCFLQVIERYLWKQLYWSNFREYFLTTIFACIGIFVYVLRTTINNKYIEKFSHYSMPIYFLHPLAIRILKLLCANFLKFDIGIITNTIIGNFIFILVVYIFSCVLYDLFKNLRNYISKINFYLKAY